MKLKKTILELIIIASCVGLFLFINTDVNFNTWSEKLKEEEIETKKESIEYVNKKPEDVYIPVLMYHSISGDKPMNSLLIHPMQFRSQIKWLKDNEFTPMLMDDVYVALKTGKVPKRPVAITFDDGYIDNYTMAYKILKQYNMKGTFFIITDCIDSGNAYMTSKMLREMKDNGMAIESHTNSHRELPKLSKEGKIKEIKKAKEILKEKVGVDSNYVCYPVGRYNNETIEVVKSQNIKAAVTTQNGLTNIKNGQYSLNRVRISPMNLDAFKAIFKDYIK